MIELVKLKKNFGEHRVLWDLSLKIPREKITVIIGPSGTGKSVLLKHMIGLLKPDAGDVVVDGTPLSKLDEKQLKEMRKKFGMLFQHAALFDSMNVYDNVAFPLKEHTSLTDQEIKTKVHAMLQLVGLKNVDAKMPGELSGGMRKRVGLARALVLKPKILLYDEPTTGLDPLATDAVNQLILNTQKELGITSVVISHDIQATFRIADKVAMLHEGQIILEGNEASFRSSKIPFVKSFLEGKAECS
ncbi:MAG: ABC transporter ATP-binding protein [Deltaproteobacteria bacterium GWA2_45_12]|nr:MAG: ABC transporter ATP-binding protein [Deltaproteobacteria bacterium GWA2_45_12]